MPRSRTGIKRPPVNPVSKANAIMAVTYEPGQSISIREAYKIYNVSLATLPRHLKSFKESGNKEFVYSVKYDTRTVFSKDEDEKVASYIKTVAKMNYGLTKKRSQLTYQYAAANNKIYPKKWDDRRAAGEEWMRCFMKRHKDLALRIPEPTSLARAIGLNQNTIKQFFDNLASFHDRFGPIPRDSIWNIDESGMCTVQKPPKIVAKKCERKLGAAVSTERGSLVTMIGAGSAICNL